jgi:hypothetical protein
MYLLVSGATKTVQKYIENTYLGQFITPRANCNIKNINNIINNNCIWAADNDCYNGLDVNKYMKMIERLPNNNLKLKFVTVPDEVANAEKTLLMFEYWYPILKYYKLPLALVAQDGLKEKDIPWDKISSFFLGGSTEYKLSEEIKKLVNVAKSNGKWVHMGRVNSHKRIRYAYTIGCDSFDGTSFSMFSETYIPKALKLLNELKK